MINFRFHIVSLTAVLLALGIGLVLGTTFLDSATIDVLNNQLTDLEDNLDNAQQRNAEQQTRLDGLEQESETLEEQIGERLFTGQLSDQPVLIVAPRGIDEATVQQAGTALRQAGADLVGTWWLTERLVLDDDTEVADLGDALELSTDDVDRLRSNLAGQLGDVLFAASDADGDAGGETQDPPADPGQDGPAEPALAARLREGGFLDYQLPEGADGDVVALPPSGLRIVVVSGPDADLAPGDALLPVLIDLAQDRAVPVVATEPSLTQDDEDAPEPQPSLVVEIREDEDLSGRISTVDDVDRLSGVVATVLAVADADPGGPRIGHYGLGEGTRLLPPPEEEG
jgi:hypothetical protein